MTLRQLAKGLGWFSIGLGLTEIAAPGWLSRQIGIQQDRTRLLQTMGVREAVTGIGILMQDRPATGLWGRVAGDALDISLLAAALRSPRNQKGRLAAAVGMVVGVTLLDLVSARRLQTAW
jgi:hypothetical protein